MLFNKVIYFVGVLIYLAIIVSLILFFGNVGWIIWILIFTVIVIAYYFIFIHTIQKIKDKHKIATKSILVIIYIIWAIVIFSLIKLWINSWQDYRENIERQQEKEKESKINDNINIIIKDLSYELFNNEADLATVKKDVNGKAYYLMNYIQDSYEWYLSEYSIKNWKIAQPYIKKAFDDIKQLLIENYWPIKEDYSIVWSYYTTESRLYWYMWVLSSLLNLIDNQENIKDWLDYYKIKNTKDKSSDEYKMKIQYWLLNWIIDLRKSMKNSEEIQWYWDIFNNFPIPDWSWNSDIIL